MEIMEITTAVQSARNLQEDHLALQLRLSARHCSEKMRTDVKILLEAIRSQAQPQ